MNDIQLSIFIPSWNRPQYFNNLITSIKPQISSNIEVVSSFNPPNRGYKTPSWMSIHRNRIDIGGRANFLLGPMLTHGKYIWMIGDDETVTPNGIREILRCTKYEPGLIVNWDGQLNLGIKPGSVYANFKEFALACFKAGVPTTITALTLCSATVSLRETFSIELGLLKMETMYGQFYAMLDNILDKPVAVVSRPTFKAAVAKNSASIFQQPLEQQNAHMAMYPAVMHEIIIWLNEKMGTDLPPDKCWKPGCGFDL